MANDRRQRRGRAAEREQTDRQLRLIYMGSGAVLVIAALAVLVGLFITRYQPPRAHVLTVGGESYQAREIVDRGVYLTFNGGGFPSLSDVARSTVDRLIEDAAIRSQATQLVAPVTEDDILQELYVDLELASPLVELPAADGDATATASETPTDATPTDATATATVPAPPTPEVDQEAFASALTDKLRENDIDRETYEAFIEVRLYRERLRDYFQAEVGESGPQLHLQRIRVSTQLAAETVIAELDGGADFATLADEQSVAEGDGEGGDLGWTTLDLQGDDVRAALEGLSAGEHTVAIAAGVFFDVYGVVEVAEDRAYEDGVAAQLANQRFDAWLEGAVAAIEVEQDLSADEESWINDRVLAAVTARVGG